MGIAIPWALLMGVQTWRFGIKATPPQMPEPFHFIWGSAAMGICGVVAMADRRVGVVLAWGLLIGAMVVNYDKAHKLTESNAANANPSASQITTRQVGIIPSNYKTQGPVAK